jgi:hypothetical protein
MPSAEATQDAAQAAAASSPEGEGQEKQSSLNLMDKEEEKNGAMAA